MDDQTVVKTSITPVVFYNFLLLLCVTHTIAYKSPSFLLSLSELQSHIIKFPSFIRDSEKTSHHSVDVSGKVLPKLLCFG